jgi:hypothetical protein
VYPSVGVEAEKQRLLEAIQDRAETNAEIQSSQSRDFEQLDQPCCWYRTTGHVKKGRFNDEGAHKGAYRQTRRLAWDPASRLRVAVEPTASATVVVVARVPAAVAAAEAVEARCCQTQG